MASRYLPRTVNSETDGEVLRDPGGEHKDVEELMEAEVFGGATRALERVEDRAN